MKRLFDWDPETRTKQVFHHDEDSDHFWIETIQDEEPLLEANRQAFNSFNRADDRFGEEICGRTRVASISNTKIRDLKTRGIWQDKAKLAAWLDTPEAAPYRTRPGRVA